MIKYVLSGLLAVLAALPARAGDAPAITLELNNARQVEAGCRVSFVVRNRMAQPIQALSLEVVLFDVQDQVDQFMKLKTGALAVGKTRVRQFDFKNRECGKLSAILINDVSECTGEGLGAALCLAALAPRSRTPIKLMK